MFTALLLLGALPLLLALRRILQHPHRPTQIPPANERVLILGASSGIGRAIARLYATRGARVCLVARRTALLHAVASECELLSPARSSEAVLALTADVADVDAMVRVRTALDACWRGVDTVVVAAGVSALRPVLAIAGAPEEKTCAVPCMQATADGIRRIVAVAAATAGNYVTPLVAAATFIPLLQNTSPRPALLLLPSLCAVVPSHTRYMSTKAASPPPYQALVEHPSVAFSFVLPATVKGADPHVHGLEQDALAQGCVWAVDGDERADFMPAVTRLAPLLSWLWPVVTERQAKKMYDF